jgi:hypothetical protein
MDASPFLSIRNSRMFRIDAQTPGKPRGYCDGVSRRSFLQLGVAGMASVGLGGVWRAQTASAAGAVGAARKDTSVIMLWLDGGAGHMDTYDMKPDAPPEYRGIWSPIKTNVKGMQITELFPLQAKIADKFSILRSLHHDNGDHFSAAHLLLTGRPGASGADQTQKAPGVSAIAARLAGPRKPGLPAHIAVPYSSTVGIRPGYFTGSYMGKEGDPFETNGDPNAGKFSVQNLTLSSGMTVERLDDRRSLVKHLDRIRREADNSGMMKSMDQFDQKAFDLVTSNEARAAFDIGSESDAVRASYGRNGWGQSCLLAARLAQAGATFLTVHFAGWDHHWDLKKGMEDYLPRLDLAIHGLINDLIRRGIYDKTMVIVVGEFGRTPKMNDGGNGGAPGSMGTPGRDHWGNAMSLLIGGGGVQGGRVVGSTNRLGEHPVDRPVTPWDLHQTIYHVLGVNPVVRFLHPAGRPVPAADGGSVIRELF